MRYINLHLHYSITLHFALYIKLMKRYVPVQMQEIIENLFFGCCACAKWGNSWSTWFQIEFGMSQGYVLSPLLFDINGKKLGSLNTC